jgi:hypothetical protein
MEKWRKIRLRAEAEGYGKNLRMASAVPENGDFARQYTLFVLLSKPGKGFLRLGTRKEVPGFFGDFLDGSD